MISGGFLIVRGLRSARALLLSRGEWCTTAFAIDVGSIVQSTSSIEGNASEEVECGCNDSNADGL